MTFVKFIICSLVIILAGIKIAKYGDVIAEKTVLGRRLVGFLLLALITSLPEVFCGISAVALVGIPDLTMGDIFGSCMFNLFILGVLDVFSKKEPFLYKASNHHLLSAGSFIALMGFVLVCLFLSHQVPQIGRFSIGWVGFYALLIPVFYILIVRVIFQHEQTSKPASEEKQYGQVSLKITITKFVIASLVVIAAAMWLPKIGEELAHQLGWANSFVGTLFLAGTTSFPELVVAITAWRIGAKDMAIANIIGSNIFDLLIIAINDIFYRKGSFLADVSFSHLFTGIISIMMMGIVVIGVVANKNKKTFGIVNWDGLLIIILFFAGLFGLQHLAGIM